jgi:hypothetical protein
VGKAIWWTTMSGVGGPESELGTEFTAVARGRLDSRLRIRAEWADVPRGRDLNWGAVLFEIVKTRGRSTQIREVGDIKDDQAVWTPCTPRRANGGRPGPPTRCEPRALRFSRDVDLTGVWTADDGAIYYVRQLGTTIWWSAMSGLGGPESDLGTEFNPVGRGRLGPRMRIRAEWADVPRGRDLNWGTILFEVRRTDAGSTQIREVGDTEYDGNVWTPCTPRRG